VNCLQKRDENFSHQKEKSCERFSVFRGFVESYRNFTAAFWLLFYDLFLKEIPQPHHSKKKQTRTFFFVLVCFHTVFSVFTE